jgi:hypothetical protein
MARSVSNGREREVCRAFVSDFFFFFPLSFVMATPRPRPEKALFEFTPPREGGMTAVNWKTRWLSRPDRVCNGLRSHRGPARSSLFLSAGPEYRRKPATSNLRVTLRAKSHGGGAEGPGPFERMYGFREMKPEEVAI